MKMLVDELDLQVIFALVVLGLYLILMGLIFLL